MKRTIGPLALTAGFLLTCAATGSAQTAPLRCPPVDEAAIQAPYVFQYGLSGTALQQNFYGQSAVANDGSYNDRGYRPLRLTGYVDNGSVRFATKWVKDAGPEWRSRFGMTGTQFHDRFLTLRAQGFRILDASGYNTPNGLRYADIWVRNTTGVDWAVTRDVTVAEIDGLKLTMRSRGLAPTHIEGYTGPNGGQAFIITWLRSPCEWLMDEELTGAQYQAFFDANRTTMRLVHVDAYRRSTLVRFAGIFWRQAGPVFRASHGQHWYKLQRSFNANTCAGYALDNFYAMELPDGWNAFGGIWSYRGVPNVSAASSLATRVNYRVNCAAGRAGAALINVTTGETLLSHGDQWFGTASSSKAWVLFALMRKADAEDINLDVTQVNGKTLATLATEMIVDSNNASTNTLVTYVGMAAINDELEALGLTVSRLRRYYTGGPSAHGLSSWLADFKAGYDNFTTPRELATFWRRVWQNQVRPLSVAAYSRFFDITGSAPTTANNYLSAGYDPSFVTFFNKAGGKTYDVNAGEPAHRPQVGDHKVGSEGGVMSFANGNLVFYASIVDEAAPSATGPSATACIGWEAAKTWGGGNPGDSSGNCTYP